VSDSLSVTLTTLDLHGAGDPLSVLLVNVVPASDYGNVLVTLGYVATALGGLVVVFTALLALDLCQTTWCWDRPSWLPSIANLATAGLTLALTAVGLAIIMLLTEAPKTNPNSNHDPNGMALTCCSQRSGRVQ
jgi:hypothetical protein